MNQKIALQIYSFFCVFFIGSNVHAINNSDLKKENKFHKIYEVYNSVPTPSEKWEPSAQKGKTQKYFVQKGDTLWGVSETLFGDGFFWSKVWSLNPNIKNPHEINLGAEIQFIPGSDLNAPSLNISNQSDKVDTENIPVIGEVVDISKVDFKEVVLSKEKEFQLESDDKIPKSSRKSLPLLNNFPQSIPDWKMETRTIESGAVMQRMSRQFIDAELYLPYFITEVEPSSVGKIHEMELTSRFAGVGDYLFIEGTQLKIGELYTVFNVLGNVEVNNKSSKENPLMIQVQGEVKVVSKVESLFKAKVTKAIVPVEINSFLLESAFPVMNMGIEKNSPIVTRDIAAEVVGGDFNVDRKLMAEQNILFLNKGTKEGFKLGDLVPLYATRGTRQISSKILQDKRQIGLVKIVKIEDNYSTGLILHSTEEVMPGDTTSIGQVSERAQKEESASILNKNDVENFDLDE
jgi:hypothetical protein